MPITRRNGKYYWGSKGPFATQAKAEEVAQAAYASGYKGSVEIEKILPALGAALGAARAAKKIEEVLSGGADMTVPDPMDEQMAHTDQEWENAHRNKAVQKLISFVQKDVSRFTPEELNQLERDENVYFNRETLETPKGNIPQAGRQARPYARPDKLEDTDLSPNAYGADWRKQPGGPDRYTGRGMQAPLTSYAEDYGPTPQEWNAISQPETPEERRQRENRIGMYGGLSTPRPGMVIDEEGDEVTPQPSGNPYRNYQDMLDQQAYGAAVERGRGENPYSPADWARDNPKKAVQKLMVFIRKADDEPPKYHPVTGQRINAPTSGGKMGPNLTPSHIGGELEQQMFPDINGYYDNIQSKDHLSPKERNLYAPGTPMTPKKYENTAEQPLDLTGKDHSFLVEAELGHDRVDDDRAGSQWVPGRFIGRPTHDGAYHNGFGHMLLDELYGRTHQGYNHGYNDLSAHMGSEFRGEYRDVYSHHPHNEHLAVDEDGNTTGQIVNPLNGEQLNTKTYHGATGKWTDDKSNRNVDNPILDNIPGSLTDSHKSTFGRKEGWAWNHHGLFQRAIKRGEKMRFSTWMLGFALGAEHINANNDVPYGFNSFGNRISPSSHRQDMKISSELHRPVNWTDKDGQPIENKPLLHYSLPHSMDRGEEASVRQLDKTFLPPGLQSRTKMSFLDDFGPMDIHQALDLIENPNHNVDHGRVQMTRIDPSTGAKIEDAFPRLRNPMNYQSIFEHTEENKANQRHGEDYDWDDEHTRNYFGHGLDGRLFGNFLPEQDPLSRYAQLQYHDGLRGLWNTENPETGGDVYTEEDYANRRISPWMAYHPKTGQRNFPLRKAPYFVNPADPFGRGEEDKPSQQGGGYGDEVKDVLGSPNISSDPMAEFAPRGRQERQPQFHRPWGVNYHPGAGSVPLERWPNVYSSEAEAAKAQQFQLKPPAPLKGGPGGHLASEPLHHDNASGTSDKREFDRYLHKLSNGERMPSWEHHLGLVRGADYHNHNAVAINNFTQDEAQYKRLGHWNRRVDEDRDMGILGQDRSVESIEHPLIVINRGTIPRNDYSYHTGKTHRQLAPSEEGTMGLKPNAPKTGSGGMAYEGLMTPDDADFALNSKWHHGYAIQPPENTPMYGIPWPFHNIRGTPKRDDDDPFMNISQEDMYNPEISHHDPNDPSLYRDVEAGGQLPVEYRQTPMTLKQFLSLSGPQLQQGIENHKFQGHPWVEGESPLTTDTTGEPGILHTKGANKDWDNLLDARWQAWVSYLNHVLEHEPDLTGIYEGPGSIGEEDPRLQKLFQLRKEGAGGGDGGAFNGLSDTVFTSTNAGIFSPTYGGDKTQRRHEKRHKAQEKKRKKLLGKDKKSGVDRLVQFLYDGSPNMSKARKMGLAPGLDDDMTGQAQTAHAGLNNPTGLTRLNWKKDVTEDTLNHKRTSRPLEDALKTAENNEPHINMGIAGGMETGTTSTYPRHESVNSVGNAKNPRVQKWGQDKSYVQKAVNEATTMTSPTENKPWSLEAPQDKFIQRAGDNPNEPPAKDAVVKENDMQRRAKKYDNKEDEGNEPYQVEGAMATPGMGGYPSGTAMQMAYTSDYGRDDALRRGGDEDMEDPEVTEEGSALPWVSLPETEKVAKLEAMRKELEEAGDEMPILNALLKVDYA